ncbi:centromere protein R isoform X3 [Lonchura striata]|uniref:Centromere protein R n=1 Tax=Lonchura striata TaxID=40157 RepID=A0A218UIS2_9PASE|nr:centromere protein R isoform X3 [Lonchura striata domestica]OWK53262.1 Centromere protein R [Lonchura striata domestica]
MSVKRALNLDTVQKDNATDATPLKAKMSNLSFFSPTTGTRRLSPCSSPTRDRAQDPSSAPAEGGGNEQSNSKSGFSRRGQPQTEDDVFLQVQSQVRNSLPRILKLRANLTSLKALEGSRELENILGVSHSSCDLSAELQKTQALVSQAEKLQLLKENYGKVPARDPIQATGSAAFLLSFLDRRKEPLGLLPAPRHSQSDQDQGIM